MKFLYILPLAALAALGISINSAYYFDSFINAGYPVLFAYGLSGSFMGLEAVIWIYPGRSWFLPALKFSIIVFSISATLGSQFFSTSELESDITKAVYVELDTSGDVEYYRDQIKILNTRIDEYISQQLIFGSERNREEREKAESDKAKYELKLEGSQNQKQEDVEKINKPLSIYSFYAYRIPEILSGNFGEDFIRVCFQLFSSVLLALIAPICLSMIRMSIIYRKPENDNPIDLDFENKEIEEPIKEEKQQKTPENKSRTKDLARIIDMLLFYYPDKGIISPEKAVEFFHNINKSRPHVKAYSIEDCKKVYEKVIPFNGLDKEQIKSEVLQNAY